MPKRRSWLGAASLAGAILAGGIALGPGLTESRASSHWDAPMVVPDPQLDATDMYAFTSPDAPDTMTVAVNYHPFQAPGTPVPYRFATDARYDVHFDSTGDGKADVTYRWTFRDEDNRGLVPAYVTGVVDSLDSGNLRFRQRYTLQKLRPGAAAQTLVRDGTAAPTHFGRLVMPDYDKLRGEAIERLPGGGKTYAGQAADPFYTNLKATSLIRFGAPTPPLRTPTPLNVSTMVLQVPKSEVALRGDAERNPVVGVWATAARKALDLRAGGADTYRQVSRVGNPTFNEVFVRCPAVLPCTANDRYNASTPDRDRATAEIYDGVLHPLKPKLIQSATGVKAPAEPRRDLENAWLTGLSDGLNSPRTNKDADRAAIVPAEELRLNMSTPPTGRADRLGYVAGDPQGFPNGRRLDDDVSASVLSLLMGALTAQSTPGIGPDVTGGRPVKPNTTAFPYLPTPLHP